MIKSAQILKSQQLSKVSNYVNEFGQQSTFTQAPGIGGASLGVADAAQIAYSARQGINTARNTTVIPTIGSVVRNTAQHYSGLGPNSGLVSRAFGRVLTPLAIAGSAYGVGSAANNFGKSYTSSGFAGNPGGFTNYAFGTTEGRNRIADVVGSGGLTLAGATIGGSLGLLPGAVLGAAVGGAAELGMAGYRKATGWDGQKFDDAKNLYKGNMGTGQVTGMMQDAISNKNRPMFKQEGLFGTRDLGAEAFADVQKENKFLKNKNNAFQSNI